MALITTPGDITANSYASIAEADAYHALRGNATWAGDDALKEAALIRATQWLDGRYGHRWPGLRWRLRLQALDWPRYDATDRDGTVLDMDEIPIEVINATAEAALRELITPNGLSPDVTPANAKVLVQVEGIRWQNLRASAGVNDMIATITVVDRLLAPLIGGAGGVMVQRA